jgi:hypothetical protein
VRHHIHDTDIALVLDPVQGSQYSDLQGQPGWTGYTFTAERKARRCVFRQCNHLSPSRSTTSLSASPTAAKM